VLVGLGRELAVRGTRVAVGDGARVGVCVGISVAVCVGVAVGLFVGGTAVSVAEIGVSVGGIGVSVGATVAVAAAGEGTTVAALIVGAAAGAAQPFTNRMTDNKPIIQRRDALSFTELLPSSMTIWEATAIT
jgi:hypothetical protein